MPDFYSLKVDAIQQLTPSSVALSFEIPDSLQQVFSFSPGQYITIKKELNGQDIRRAYSISSTPASGKLTVGVKKVPNGIFSTYANEEIRVGDVLQVMPPEGRFVFESNNGPKIIAAFAAGSGITPILSIAQTALENHADSKFVLVYGNKSPEETMYLKAIKELQTKYGNRFFVQWVFSRISIPDSVFGRIERSTVNLILKNKFKGVDFDAFYLCGPEQMIETVSSTLKNNGINDEKILFELFTASKSEDNISNDSEGKTRVFLVLDDEDFEFSMSKKQLLLDAVLKENIDAPYSCQGGVCSSCIARITKGNAKMVKNQILTDEEIDDGLVLTCQAYPMTSVLKVDFDDV